ncbi:mannonate dehydratase [Aminobacter aganoensis]|uniref:Mannonate dehydratase n=1 Tax=Aminobacter aganoensis TaxID=83264 RepID=A0A7X0KML0_9HYPH|nr:mannonate dehydratase [Aminobacter aganoensis]MBB6356250.1 mannonate dehydratase [Aminobacter aganoensis]
MTIDWIRQSGVTSVEASLSQLPPGCVWEAEAIDTLKKLVQATPPGQTPLAWDTLGGIAIADDIKLGRKDSARLTANFQETVRRLAQAGVRRINFTVMPLLDWVRTGLSTRLESGAEALGFDTVDFAVFDVHLVKRPGAEEELDPWLAEAARRRHAETPAQRWQELLTMLTRGLPGGPGQYANGEFHSLLGAYQKLGTEAYRQNLIDFLGEVARTCEEEGAVFAIHPDDPPIPLCGLPRIASTLDDFAKIFEGVSSPRAGMIFCSGSLASRRGNVLADFIDRFGSRIFYAHPRRIRFRDEFGSFTEAEHLGGTAAFDLHDVLDLLMAEEARRRSQGVVDWEIPYRADHACRILYDQERADFVPGYTPIGLVKATAELRGMIHAIGKRS